MFVAATEVMTLEVGEDGVMSVAFSPDGKRIAACGRSKALVRIWDTERGDEVITLRLPGVPWASGHFSPDGKTFAVPLGAETYANTITLFESTGPARGYERRRTAEAARRLVDELYGRHGSYTEVTYALRNDEILDEPIRKVALQIANARKGEDAYKLYRESRDALSSRRSDPNAYRVALEKAERANRLEPNNLGILP